VVCQSSSLLQHRESGSLPSSGCNPLNARLEFTSSGTGHFLGVLENSLWIDGRAKKGKGSVSDS
jgi:hypothetical protein